MVVVVVMMVVFVVVVVRRSEVNLHPHTRPKARRACRCTLRETNELPTNCRLIRVVLILAGLPPPP